MKTPSLRAALAVAAVALTLAAGLVPWSSGQQKGGVDTREIMQAKLLASQRVLEGIAQEDYNEIFVNAQRLGQISKASNWHSRQTPEYELLTNEFQRQADALARAAEKKNLDAASLTYFQLTLSCTACHKYLRATRSADIR